MMDKQMETLEELLKTKRIISVVATMHWKHYLKIQPSRISKNYWRIMIG